MIPDTGALSAWAEGQTAVAAAADRLVVPSGVHEAAQRQLRNSAVTKEGE